MVNQNYQKHFKKICILEKEFLKNPSKEKGNILAKKCEEMHKRYLNLPIDLEITIKQRSFHYQEYNNGDISKDSILKYIKRILCREFRKTNSR